MTAVNVQLTLCHYRHQTYGAFLLSILRPIFECSEDFDELLVPILRRLYNFNAGKIESAHLALSVVLTFSQEATFGERTQSMNLEDLAWFEPRSLSNVSIGTFDIWLGPDFADLRRVLLKLRRMPVQPSVDSCCSRAYRCAGVVVCNPSASINREHAARDPGALYHDQS